jgi:hypothetical protein
MSSVYHDPLQMGNLRQSWFRHFDASQQANKAQLTVAKGSPLLKRNCPSFAGTCTAIRSQTVKYRAETAALAWPGMPQKILRFAQATVFGVTFFIVRTMLRPDISA